MMLGAVTVTQSVRPVMDPGRGPSQTVSEANLIKKVYLLDDISGLLLKTFLVHIKH